MASVSGSDPTADARSGGKIVTKKRRRVTTTPYDRPPPPQQQPPPPQGSPNWLTGVIFPATRMIASGAVKMISSVFDSSSSSSDSEGNTADDVTNDDRYDYADGVNDPNKEHVISSEARNFVNKEPQLNLHNSVTKSAIARLVMQERFSRQERDRFVQIIDSRVTDAIVGGEADAGLVDIPVGNIRYDTTDLCAEAVLEARKWLEEKKVGSSPSSDLAHDSRSLDTVDTVATVALHCFENEAGSPVDVAKSYMNSRLPWASPIVEHNELHTPFALTPLFREGTSAAFGGGSLSSSKKRNSLASGSWNIEEELRRVRSKASEDMLSSLPSTSIDLASFRTTPKSGENSLIADSPICGGMEGKSKLMTETQPVDASRAAAGLSSYMGISDVEMRTDVLENDSLKSHPAHLSSEEFQKKNLEAVKMIGECAGFNSDHSVHLDIGLEPCDDPRSCQRKVPPVEDARESEIKRNVNGLHTSQAGSFFGEVGTGDIHTQPDKGNPSPINLNMKISSNVQVEDTCELLSEASVDVLIVDETNGVDVSQGVSSGQHEESSLVLQPNTHKLAGTDDGMALKQEGKKPVKFSRRGRGKGK